MSNEKKYVTYLTCYDPKEPHRKQAKNVAQDLPYDLAMWSFRHKERIAEKRNAEEKDDFMAPTWEAPMEKMEYTSRKTTTRR